MDDERLAKMFAEADDEYLEFVAIPIHKRVHSDRHICGLMKLATLIERGKHFTLGAGHNVIYLASAGQVTDEITQEDVVYLARCGQHFDGDSCCIAVFC